MSAQAQSIPGEIHYHFVTTSQSTDSLLSTLYNHPGEATKQHFMSVNQHIGQQVRPGQMVFISPPDSLQCSALESDLTEIGLRLKRVLRVVADN